MCSEPSIDVCVSALQTSGTQISSVVVAGVILCLSIIALRWTKKREFSFQGFSFRISYFPTLAIVFTIAHAYVASIHADRVNDLLQASRENRSKAWFELTKKGPLIFQSMQPRTLIETYQAPVIGPIKIYSMSQSDKTTWLSVSLAFALLVATVLSFSEGKFRNWRTELSAWASALGLAAANWSLGSWWAIETSKLFS